MLLETTYLERRHAECPYIRSERRAIAVGIQQFNCHVSQMMFDIPGCKAGIVHGLCGPEVGDRGVVLRADKDVMLRS